MKTLRFRSPRAFVATFLAAALIGLPTLIGQPQKVLAAGGPALGYIGDQGKEVRFQGIWNLASAAGQQPSLSLFNVQVDGARVDVISIDYSLPGFLDLVLANPIFVGSTASVSYTAPSPVDNTLNNAALQKTDGEDIISFSFQLDTSNAAKRVATPSAPTVVAGQGSATITVATPGSPTPRSYLVTASPGGATCTVTGLTGSCTIIGLTGGTSYTFAAVGNRSGMADSFSSPASTPITVLSVISWDVDPASESETDAFTEGFWPAAIPGNIIITSEFGFTVDKKNGIKPKIRMKNYAGKIKMTISAKYKDGSKTKNYKCTYAPFGSTKKVKTAKWKWYTPKKACILPKALVTAIQTGTATLNAKGKWTRTWVTSGKKARPDKTKIKPRTLKYTVRAKPAVAK